MLSNERVKYLEFLLIEQYRRSYGDRPEETNRLLAERGARVLAKRGKLEESIEFQERSLGLAE